MFQHAARRCAVGEELGAVFLGGNGKPDGVLCHSDRRIAHQPVKAQTGNMKHILGESLITEPFMVCASSCEV